MKKNIFHIGSFIASRKIYQTKPKWVDFRDRVKKVASGAHIISDKIQFQET